MKRRGLLLSLALLTGGPGSVAHAQFRAVAPGEVLRGRFTQERSLKGFERPLISSGDFVLEYGLGLIWRTERPFAIATVITAMGLVQDVAGAETTRLAASRLPFLARLYDLLKAALSGDWQALTTMFQVTRHDEARRWDIALLPRTGADPLTMPFRSITLRGGQFLEYVLIVRLDGDSDRLVFSDQSLGSPLTGAETARLHWVAK
jgi:hypothetical protein